jgi:hypothetical protein
MRPAKILSITVCFVALTQSVWAQKAKSSVPGYVDPRTGTYRLLLPTEEMVDLAAATAATTGTFTTSFTITVKSTLPTTDNLACTVDIQVVDGASATNPLGRIFTEGDSVAATGTGATRTCTVSIPYSWTLTTAATDMVQLSYTVNAPGTVTATNQLPNRITSLRPFAAIKVPANGATTTQTVAVTF